MAMSRNLEHMRMRDQENKCIKMSHQQLQVVTSNMQYDNHELISTAMRIMPLQDKTTIDTTEYYALINVMTIECVRSHAKLWLLKQLRNQQYNETRYNYCNFIDSRTH